MRVEIKAGTARGTVNAPPSKSVAHRLLISAALADGISKISGISDCDDVRATVNALSALGVKITVNGDTATVVGKHPSCMTPDGPLFCEESGSTLRFILPIALLPGKTVMLRGKEGLMKRPMEIYENICRDGGLIYVKDGDSITVKGPLKSGNFTLPGNVSSQFISGLLFALPHLKGDSKISITPPIESKPYIEMTIDALSQFGVKIKWVNECTLFIKGEQKFTPACLTVEGDYSGAAFIDALGTLGGDVCVRGLREDTLQGDSVYKSYFKLFDCGVPTIHLGNCPDLGPILFAMAAARCGGIFTGTKRLKIKESDRAAVMAAELKKFGTSVSVYEDKVVVYPAQFHKPSEDLDGHGDHRIVMALAVLLTLVGGKINGAEAVSKSYPDFFSDLEALGIEVKQYDDK